MFTHARIKLTAWYLLIIMIISVFFSFAIYEVLTKELDRFASIQHIRIERRFHMNDVVPPNIQSHFPVAPNIEPELIEETKDRLIIYLIILNAGILFISGVFGYILAGRTLKPIKNMIDEQNQFISDSSHELRTPLTSLKSAFEVYLRNPDQSVSESKVIIKESIVEVNKLQALTESLLQLAQFEKPNHQTIHTSVSLKTIISEAIRKMSPVAKKKYISIIYQPIEFSIKGDMFALQDLIIILMDNAIKYSPTKSNIIISTLKKSGHVFISVTDQGVGIAKKDLPHIFNRFYRADIARSKSSTNGYGLGLSIAKKIIENHKGTIQVLSTIKKGSTFVVELPIS